MGLAFGVLALSARDFWAMTPREFSAAVGAISGHASMDLTALAPDRKDLMSLMKQYPD